MYSRDPRTKEEFLDRLLRYDFDGDIRNVGAEPATIVRTGRNKLLLKFPATGVSLELEVHRPRTEEAKAKARKARSAAERTPARNAPSERSFANQEARGAPGENGGEGQTTRRRGRPRGSGAGREQSG